MIVLKQEYNLIITLCFLACVLGNVGQSIYAQSSDYFYPSEVNKKLPSLNITSITQDDSGYLWITTAKGLCRYDGNVLRVFEPKPNRFGITGDSWYNRILFVHGKCYVDVASKEKFEVNMRTNRIDTIDNAEFLKSGFPLVKSNSTRWVVEKNFLHDKTTSALFALPYANVVLYSLCETRSGDVWLATENGAWKFSLQSKKFSCYQHNPDNPLSILNNSVREVFEDKDGVIWLGTYGDGICFIPTHKSMFETVRYSNTDNGKTTDAVIMGLGSDNEGNVWSVSTALGIAVYNRQTKNIVQRVTTKSTPLRIPENDLRMIHVTDSLVWTGGTSLLLLNRKHKSVSAINAPAHRMVFADRNNRIWCSEDHSDKGLYVVDCFTKKPISHFTSNRTDSTTITHNITNTAFQDRKGRIWFGTFSGVHYYNELKQNFVRVWMRPSSKESNNHSMLLDEYNIQSITEDANGTIWLGSRGSGLLFFNGTSVQKVPLHERRWGRYMYAIAADTAGYLWLGTENGLCKFNTQTLSVEDFFTKEDGLLDNEFNMNAVHVLHTGEIAMGGIKGYHIFNPYTLQHHTEYYPLRIDDFMVFGKEVEYDTVINERSDIVLPYHQNSISISFSLPLVENKDKYLIQYRLLGYEEKWVNSVSDYAARFTNLSAGEYIFQVQTVLPNGSISAFRWLRITIVPPFWKTWWFLLVVSVTVVSGFVVIVRTISTLKLKERIAVLEKEQQLLVQRNRISHDLHDELGSTLTKISLLSELAQRNITDATTTKYIHTISSSARDAVRSIGSIVWALNSEHDNLANMLGYIQESISDLFDETSITFTIHLPPAIPDVRVVSQVRRNVYLVIKEVCHNIIKHSQCSKGELLIAFENHDVVITLSDNGIGFNQTETRKFGNGLNSIHKRMKDIHAELSIISSQHSGTTVTMRVPGIL